MEKQSRVLIPSELTADLLKSVRRVREEATPQTESQGLAPESKKLTGGEE